MAYEGPLYNVPGLVAGADLSSHQYKYVKLSAAATVVLCAAATDKPIGILQNDPKSGQAAVVMALGVSKLVAGGALSAGDLVGTDASGLGDGKVPGTDTTNYIAGQVIEGVANANEMATVTVNCLSLARAA